MKVTFDEKALEEYISWQLEDKKTLNRINQLIKSIQRDSFMKGLGKPEPLKGRKAYSRRIDDGNGLYISGTENRIESFCHAKDIMTINGRKQSKGL